MSENSKLLNKEIQSALMGWYDGNARMLPWRESKDPYRIWVSEIMLQQTQVKTVIPYFERFIEELPDVTSLALADESRVLKLWEGLGYYSRVRNMQKAARIIVDEFQGRLPESLEKLLKLPGIGEYSAGAIASIAYGLTVPAVDGNVLRVFSRLLGSTQDISSPAVKREFQAIAVQMQPKGRPGDFNQALMELGATVCMPNGKPFCERCPVSGFCKAFNEKKTEIIPVKSTKTKRKTENRTILLVYSGSRVLLHKRADTGLLAGMAEPLNVAGGLPYERIDGFLRIMGLECESIEPLGRTKHLFTHIEWRMEGFLVRVGDTEPPDGYFWADVNSVEMEHSVPSAFKTFMKNIRLLKET